MHQSRIIELFYLFFQGAMLFQVVFFGMVYIIAKRKDVLWYTLLNLFAASYFFLNAPDTFLGIDENIVFDSPLYLYVNFALLLAMEFTYLIFLKEIFLDTVNEYGYVKTVYRITFYLIPVLYVVFVVMGMSGMKTNPIFYAGHLVNGPFCTLILLLNIRQKGYKSLVVSGMIVIFLCVIATVFFTTRYNGKLNETIFDKYPLAIIKFGMLVDIMLFQLALLRRWNEQERQLAIEKLQSQLAVEKLRNKISGELHDDIGSTLSGISMYSHMLGGMLQSGNIHNATEAVGTIQKSTDEIVGKLGDLVWAINPDKDSFANMLERIHQYGVEMCSTAEINFTWNCSEAGYLTAPGMEMRRHIYLIAKEAINNAVKYSRAKTIIVEINCEDSIFKMRIRDNGVGFNTSISNQGNGVVNMRKRATEAGALFELRSNETSGTEILLSVNITH